MPPRATARSSGKAPATSTPPSTPGREPDTCFNMSKIKKANIERAAKAKTPGRTPKEQQKFTLFMTVHQDGEKIGQPTGNVNVGFLNDFFNNDKLRTTSNTCDPVFLEACLMEQTKWSVREKQCNLRVHTEAQVKKLFDAIVKIEGSSFQKLSDTVNYDIFKDAKQPHIDVVSHKEFYVLDGKTYSLYPQLKEIGFKWTHMPDVGQVWAAEKQAINLQDVEDLCNMWGWSHKLWSSSIIADMP